MRYSNRITTFIVHPVSVFILLLTVIPLIISPSENIVADSDGLVEIVNEVGYIEFAAFGIGTRGDPDTDTGAGEGTFDVAIEREMIAVREAHLVWTGRSEDYGQPNIYDDDGVMVSINGSAPVNVMADLQFRQDPWFRGTRGEVVQLHESGDISELIADLIPVGGHYVGDITFTVTDQEHGTSAVGKRPDYDLNYGVGAWIVYEYEGADGELLSEIYLYEGQDSFFRLWTPPRGPHTEVQCVTFDPADFERDVDTTHLVSGVDLRADVRGQRSNAFWYLTGNGDVPTYDSPEPGIINAPGAIGYEPNDGEYPLHSSEGLEWDNFEPENFIKIPANDSWACFQIESGDSQFLAGITDDRLPASGMWNFFGIRMPSVIPPPDPSAVTLTSFTGARSDELTATLNWATAEEIDNFGYNVYRSESDNFAEAELIHFEATAVFGGNGPGATYQHMDTVPSYGQYYYWLEDVDTEGVKTVHGPVLVNISRTRSIYIPLIMN